jgi:hypothetical protein
MDPGTNDLAYMRFTAWKTHDSAPRACEAVLRFHGVRTLHDRDRHPEMNESQR